jgi:hypothetical protein
MPELGFLGVETEVVWLERLRKSVARKWPVLVGPWAYDRGQKVGTMAWIALRDMCSPMVCERCCL